MSDVHRVFLVRHGETKWNRDGLYNSRTDTSITDASIPVLRHSGHRLKEAKLARVWISPLARARESADIVLAEADQPQASVEIVAELAEMDYGEFEGRNPEELRESPLASVFESWLRPQADASDAPGGETWAQAFGRARRLLDALEPFDGDTLLVGHGYVFRLMLVAAAGATQAQAMRRVQFDNGRLSELHWRDGIWVLVRHNV